MKLVDYDWKRLFGTITAEHVNLGTSTYLSVGTRTEVSESGQVMSICMCRDLGRDNILRTRDHYGHTYAFTTPYQSPYDTMV
jgi:hypothetical protein